MSTFMEWATKTYFAKPTYESELESAFNAGMERAADIVHGHTTLQLGGYYTPTDGGKLEAAIRAEIDDNPGGG